MTTEKMTIDPLSLEPGGDNEIVITRHINAPRPEVFKALTTAALLKQWVGPKAYPMVQCEAEARVGGKYRFVWRGPNGEMACGGTVREFKAPSRFSATERFDTPWYPGEALITYDLIEKGGGTALKLTLRYESKEGRDGVLQSPMKHGLAESFSRLEELLAPADARA